VRVSVHRNRNMRRNARFPQKHTKNLELASKPFAK
jgi:hypothetical protein